MTLTSSRGEAGYAGTGTRPRVGYAGTGRVPDPFGMLVFAAVAFVVVVASKH